MGLQVHIHVHVPVDSLLVRVRVSKKKFILASGCYSDMLFPLIYCRWYWEHTRHEPFTAPVALNILLLSLNVLYLYSHIKLASFNAEVQCLLALWPA